MAKKASADEARYYLRDVAPETCFWINNGAIIKNIDELTEALKSIDKEKFKHHANKEKNDFAKWVDEVVQDNGLAKVISKIKSRQAMLKKVEARVKQLKKAAGYTQNP